MTATDDTIDASVVSHEWHRWAAQALLNGSTLGEVVATMSESGMTETAAAAVCGRIYTDPVFDAARLVAAQHRKMQSVLDIQTQLLALSATARQVTRCSSLTSEGFLDDFYAMNRPVVLEDACDRWPAIERWTPEYLGEALRGQDVEVMVGRESDPRYEVNAESHKAVMPFDDYVQRLMTVGASNDAYLVANNHLLESPAAATLWDDFTLDTRYLDSEKAMTRTFLWLGPRGTITPLHHDVMNVMFHQVAGRKRITLISPAETRCVYNTLSVYSDVTLERPDHDRYPAFADARPLTVDIAPGEALFIPVGWWHHVEALDRSVSVSSTSFRFPNDFTWYHPEPVS